MDNYSKNLALTKELETIESVASTIIDVTRDRKLSPDTRLGTLMALNNGLIDAINNYNLKLIEHRVKLTD